MLCFKPKKCGSFNTATLINKLFILVVATLTLSACVATEKPVSLTSASQSNIKQGNGVAIVTSKLPTPNTYFDGAGCLLCIAFAEGMHTTLTDHVQSLDSQPLKLMAGELASHMQGSGWDASLTSTTIREFDLDKFDAFDGESGFAKYDYRVLRNELNTDYVLFIDIKRVGVLRRFNSYVPESAPYAIIEGALKLVNLKTNQLAINTPISIASYVEGEWDEPAYPALTTAYFQSYLDLQALLEKALAPK